MCVCVQKAATAAGQVAGSFPYYAAVVVRCPPTSPSPRAPPPSSHTPFFLPSFPPTHPQVVSCEMIEAVGHEHLQAYFRTLGAMVRPGGKVVIQVSERCGWG